MMMVISDDDEYTRSAAAAGEERLSLSKKRKSKNKRRFSDEQIKSLETIFVSESKLEPRKKLQLATELGLQPRQVAIWFQNKRARFKSKQLERDYGLLRANYNGLASQFEALKKEKQYLQLQLQNLNEQVMKSREGNILDSSGEVKSELGLKPSALAENSGHARTDGCGPEKEVKPGPSVESTECNVCAASSDEDSSMKVEYFGLDGEPEFLNVVDPAVSTLTSQESWRSLDSSGLIDQPGGSYQWWDFWS